MSEWAQRQAEEYELRKAYRDGLEKRVTELEAALRDVHAPHPQPEICAACKLLGR